MKWVLSEHKPVIVLVNGDTTTAMVSALASFYMNIHVGHVEAGLRTHNIRSPFPEEANRQIISNLARWHFAPTVKNKSDLISEGICKDNILVTGNTVIDAMSLNFRNTASSEKTNQINAFISHELPFDWQTNDYILITCHRRENLGKRFEEILSSIKILATKFPNMAFVYPVHPNPKVKDLAYNLLKELKNIYLIGPMSTSLSAF